MWYCKPRAIGAEFAEVMWQFTATEQAMENFHKPRAVLRRTRTFYFGTNARTLFPTKIVSVRKLERNRMNWGCIPNCSATLQNLNLNFSTYYAKCDFKFYVLLESLTIGVCFAVYVAALLCANEIHFSKRSFFAQTDQIMIFNAKYLSNSKFGSLESQFVNFFVRFCVNEIEYFHWRNL